MWHAILPNKKSSKRKLIREREKEVKKSVEKKNEEKPYDFTKTDILAMIIAAFQIILPIMLIGAGVMVVFTLFFTKVFMK